MNFLPEDWLSFLLKLMGAFLLALPVAWDREKSTRIMGLRTFPLVAVASCAYVLIALNVLSNDQDAQARVVQGLITGIGFIGGGAILKQGDGNVRGTATAVSVWTTGAVGIAVAYGRFEIGIIVSIINFLALRILTPIERDMEKDSENSQEKD